MDKPVSLSVKAWIIRNMSVRTQMQEREIEMIVNHQFDSAYTALESCNSLEFSGFGRFFFNKWKALKKLEKFKSQINEFSRILNDPSSTEIRKRNIEMKLQMTRKNFEYLNTKLNGCTQDLRGMEKQVLSSEGIEGRDSESDDGEDDDL